MTLIFMQGHGAARKLELVLSICVRRYEVDLTLPVVDYVREMTTKNSCRYCEYGSFEQLFLFPPPQRCMK